MTAHQPRPAHVNRRAALTVCFVATFAAAALAAAVQGRDAAPPPDELRQLIERMIANTHCNDAAIENYERVEHWVARRTENDPQVRLDKTYRVVPTGTGTLKVVLKDNGTAVTPEYYYGELQTLAQDLEWALDPNEPKQKARVEKWKKRTAVKDSPTGPTDAHSTVLSIEEEAIIVAFASTRCCRWMTVSTLCRQRSRR